LKISETQIEQISSILETPPLRGVPLKNLTSFRVGGPADVVAFPREPVSFARLLSFVKDEGIRYFVLGSGTNVLFDDNGFRGLVVTPLRMKWLSAERNGSGLTRITAQAGTPLPLVVSRACRLGLTGMESLWGIPGSVGGAVACNAGASGLSVADLTTKLELVNTDGKTTELKKGDFEYGYRFCNLPPDSAVLQASFELYPADSNEIERKLQEVKTRRRLTQPRGYPNAGCVFKNPATDIPAGALIEKLGFKGTSCGGAEVSKVHANFIINRNKAKARDILFLINKIVEAAQKETGVVLELEIRHVKSSEDHV
jgi:UDP-N-acetylmuramate dehydrogenase